MWGSDISAFPAALVTVLMPPLPLIAAPGRRPWASLWARQPGLDSSRPDQAEGDGRPSRLTWGSPGRLEQ